MRGYAEYIGLHAIEELNFCNPNFICRITFNCSFVLNPLQLEITINLEVMCLSPIDCIFSVVFMTSNTLVD